jgi:heat shock protein HslJ
VTHLAVPVVAAVAVLLTGCGEGDAGSDSSELEGVPWVMTAGIAIPGWEAAPPSVTFDGARMGGFTGCNSYGGPYTVDGSSLELGQLAMTLVGCPSPAAEVETAFLAALERVAAWRIEDDELLLLDADEAELLRFAPGTPNGSWRATGFLRGEDFRTVIAGVEITATFTEEGELRGGSGCNTYRSTLTTDGIAITIAPPAATRKFCAQPEGVMEQEAAYLQALSNAERFRLDGSTLRLTRADGTHLVDFARAARP